MDYNNPRLRGLMVKARAKNLTVEDLDTHEFVEWLTFDSKFTYDLWVDEWKNDYRSLAESIRNARRICKETQRAGEVDDAATLQSELKKMGRTARIMLALRHAGKRHSWALREEAQFSVSI